MTDREMFRFLERESENMRRLTELESQPVTCPVCKGTGGPSDEEYCRRCEGSGEVFPQV